VPAAVVATAAAMMPNNRDGVPKNIPSRACEIPRQTTLRLLRS